MNWKNEFSLSVVAGTSIASFMTFAILTIARGFDPLCAIAAFVSLASAKYLVSR